MPGIHQLLVVVCRNLLDPPQFFSRKPATSFEANWIEPHLCLATITFHMHVWPFIPVTGIEKESIHANSQNGGHQSLAMCVSAVTNSNRRHSRFLTERPGSPDGGNRFSISKPMLPTFRCIILFK